jgi:hypothetical protein
VIDQPFFVQFQLQPFENLIESTVVSPTAKPCIYHLPLSVSFRNLSPLRTRVKMPHYAIDRSSMFVPLATAMTILRE